MSKVYSAGIADKVKEELPEGYPEDTPIVVIEKASWPGQKIARGRLSELTEVIEKEGIKKTALIYVGEALKASEEGKGKRSKLYDRNFNHEFRKKSQ